MAGGVDDAHAGPIGQAGRTARDAVDAVATNDDVTDVRLAAGAVVDQAVRDDRDARVRRDVDRRRRPRARGDEKEQGGG
jgi:hypothetical protein